MNEKPFIYKILLIGELDLLTMKTNFMEKRGHSMKQMFPPAADLIKPVSMCRELLKMKPAL